MRIADRAWHHNLLRSVCESVLYRHRECLVQAVLELIRLRLASNAPLAVKSARRLTNVSGKIAINCF